MAYASTWSRTFEADSTALGYVPWQQKNLDSTKGPARQIVISASKRSFAVALTLCACVLLGYGVGYAAVAAGPPGTHLAWARRRSRTLCHTEASTQYEDF